MTCTFVSSLLLKTTLVAPMETCVRLHADSARALSSCDQMYKHIIQVYFIVRSEI